MSTPAPPLRVRSREVWIVLLNVLALVGTIYLLWHLRTIVTWVLVSVFLALALRPVVALMTRRGVRRGLAVAIVALGVLGVIGVLVGTFVPLAIEQARQLFDNAPELLSRIERWDPVRWIVRRFGRDYEPEALFRDQVGNVAGQAWSVARSVFEGVFGAITIATLTVFMLLFGDEIVDKALAWLPPHRRAHASSLAHRMTKVVGGYVAGTLIVASVGGVVMGVTLAILGVPYFLPLGLAMIVLGIVPYIGSAIGAVLLVGVTFASQGWKEGLICAVVYLIYQQIENEILQPVVQRRTIRMNALFVALALLAGAAIAGIVGTLLALPIAGAIQIVLGDALDRRRSRWGELPGEPAKNEEPTERPRDRHPTPEPRPA